MIDQFQTPVTVIAHDTWEYVSKCCSRDDDHTNTENRGAEN